MVVAEKEKENTKCSSRMYVVVVGGSAFLVRTDVSLSCIQFVERLASLYHRHKHLLPDYANKRLYFEDEMKEVPNTPPDALTSYSAFPQLPSSRKKSKLAPQLDLAAPQYELPSTTVVGRRSKL